MILTKELCRLTVQGLAMTMETRTKSRRVKEKALVMGCGERSGTLRQARIHTNRQKTCSATSCFGSRLANHPRFDTWAVTPTQTSRGANYPEGRLKMEAQGCSEVRSASCSRVFNLDPTDGAKDSRPGGKVIAQFCMA